MMVIIDDDNGDDDDEEMTMMMMIRHACHITSYSLSYWRCSGCVVMIIIMTVGDAEDAR